MHFFNLLSTVLLPMLLLQSCLIN